MARIYLDLGIPIGYAQPLEPGTTAIAGVVMLVHWAEGLPLQGTIGGGRVAVVRSRPDPQPSVLLVEKKGRETGCRHRLDKVRCHSAIKIAASDGED